MRYVLLTLLLTTFLAPATAQTPWNGQWIYHPEVGPQEQAVVLFRTEFDLTSVPDSFPINITADNHFRLYVNGKWIAFGPQLGEISYWRYDTHDLAEHLKPGKNVLAVEVINWGHKRMFGIQSVHTALTISGVGPAEVVSTDGYSPNYKTYYNRGLRSHEVRWREGPGKNDIIGGLYANNPTDSLLAERYPWGWEQLDYDDSKWPPAPFLEATSMAADGSAFLWRLEPRSTPSQRHRPQLFKAVRTAEGLTVGEDWLLGDEAIQLRPERTYRLLLDLEELTVAHPEIRWSGGAGSEIKLTWVENLFTPEGNKVHRDSVAGLQAKGIFDVIRPDGGVDRRFVPTWYRAFRYLEILVTTGEQPLELFAPVPLKVSSTVPTVARFTSSDERLNTAFDISRRTVENCTQDYFLSDAYYETMQYIGDTKVHALAWQALSGDYRHTRNALQDFHRSRNPDGVLKSCYPLRYNFYHGSYSLIWIDMVADYFLATRDTTLVLEQLAGIDQTLAYFDRHFNEATGFIDEIPYKPFIDWYTDNKRGWAPGIDQSASVPITLQYAHALQSATLLLNELKRDKPLADSYDARREYINQRMRECCYDEARQLFAERPSKDYFDQHSTTLAVLTGAMPPDAMREGVGAMVTDPSLSPATFYFRYYVFEALVKSGRRDLALQVMQPWFDIVADGATTVVERFEGDKPTRSEAHPWGAAPVIYAYRLFAGIDLERLGPAIKMEPYLGELDFLGGYCPAFGVGRGVQFSLRKGADGQISGTVRAESLPVELTVNGRQLIVPASKGVSF